MNQFEKYIQKNDIQVHDILYIYRQQRKTFICCKNGEEKSTSIPVHEILEYLPSDKFLSVTKGVIVHLDQIVHISDDGIYTMTNGKTFQGRQRFLSAHKKLRKKLMLNVSAKPAPTVLLPTGFLEKCHILDNMPIAYCVIELVFDEHGHGIDFIFRYCNKHMEVVEGIPLEDMLDRSFYEVFKNGDKKWLISYADVALNGVQCTLHDYSPEIDKFLTVHCYQPEPGFCACVLIPEEND